MTKRLPVVVLAGGLGTRLGNIGSDKPKAMVEVAGRPFLDWKIRQLLDQKVDSIYLLTGHFGSQIHDFIAKKDYGIPIVIVPDGPRPSGTARALANAMPAVCGDQFVLTYGDNLLSLEIAQFAQDPKNSQGVIMVVTDKIGPSDQPNARVEDGLVIEYSKSGGSHLNLIDYGYALISKSEFLTSLKDTDIDMGQVFTRLSNERRLGAFETSLSYMEIGTPESLKRTSNALTRRN
jgi:NDP-sugar pyrophosphorylase family protein